MLNGVVADRYASALFELAQEQGKLESIELELAVVSKSLEQTPEFVEFLTHPKVAVEEKKQKVEAAFNQAVSAQVLNFLKLVLDHGREVYLQEIYQRFVELADAALGRVKIHLESAQEITDAELQTIGQQLFKSAGKSVALTSSVNSDLIGGVRVRFGDRVIDASVKGLLNNFRESLKRQQVR